MTAPLPTAPTTSRAPVTLGRCSGTDWSRLEKPLRRRPSSALGLLHPKVSNNPNLLYLQNTTEPGHADVESRKHSEKL
ncbi:hypothetical protein AGIG_G1572 [Arapaima gigas]